MNNVTLIKEYFIVANKAEEIGLSLHVKNLFQLQDSSKIILYECNSLSKMAQYLKEYKYKAKSCEQLLYTGKD